MASFEEAIYARLGNPGDLRRAALGPVFDTTPKQGTPTPYHTFQVLDDRDEVHFGGTDATHPTFVQVDGWYPTAAARRVGRRYLAEILRSWSGEWGGIRIERAFVEFNTNTTEPGEDGKSLPVFRNIQRWKVLVTDAAIATP